MLGGDVRRCVVLAPQQTQLPLKLCCCVVTHVQVVILVSSSSVNEETSVTGTPVNAQHPSSATLTGQQTANRALVAMFYVTETALISIAK